jgi:hypothetical protein
LVERVVERVVVGVGVVEGVCWTKKTLEGRVWGWTCPRVARMGEPLVLLLALPLPPLPPPLPAPLVPPLALAPTLPLLLPLVLVLVLVLVSAVDWLYCPCPCPCPCR